MLRFVKILDYDRSPIGSMFDLLCKITLQTADPPSKHPRMLSLDQKIVYYSTLRRASECILFESDKSYIEHESLREIRFDLAACCREDEWQKQQSVIVRKRFNDLFVADRLVVSRERIYTEIIEFLRLIVSRHPSQDVAVVSHSFRMKIIEAFIRTHGELCQNPALIRNYIIPETRTFEFGKGFCATFDEIMASI